MKSKLLLAALLFLSSLVSAQSSKNYFFTIEDHQIGGYAALNGRVSSLNSHTAGFADIKVMFTINGEWAIGFMGSGLYYDRGLNELVNDGTYHLNASYGAIVIERIFTLNPDMKLSLSIASGNGDVNYRYDSDYRKEKTWSEEIIDKTTFAIFEPSVEIQHRIFGNWWVGLLASYRNTSPVKLINTDEDLFRKFSGGVSIKWGLF